MSHKATVPPTAGPAWTTQPVVLFAAVSLATVVSPGLGMVVGVLSFGACARRDASLREAWGAAVAVGGGFGFARAVLPEVGLADPWSSGLQAAVLLGAMAVVYRHVVQAPRASGARDEKLESAEEQTLQIRLALAEAEQRSEAAVATRNNRSRFLANMSHEIRTPLNGIIGMLGLLLDDVLAPVHEQYARDASRSAKSLLYVINDILDFSKIDSGELTLEAVRFDPRRVLDDVGSMLSLRARERGVELLFDVDPLVPTAVVGDPHRLRQVVLNLAGNAVKFTRDGTVMIRVAVGPYVGTDSYSGPIGHLDESTSPALVAAEEGQPLLLNFRVQDSGIGIPEAALEGLFDPYTQADSSTTRRFGGTGLGLAICRELAVLMGGEIGVTSKVGQGSTFWFTASFVAAKGAQPVPTAAGLKDLRVLVADDMPVVRRLFVRMLSRWGCAVYSAADVDGAWDELVAAHARGQSIDVVFIDKRMPGGGFSLAERMVDDPVFQSTARVMLTGFPTPADQDRCQELGFASLMTKPPRHDALEEALRRIQGLPTGQAPVAAPVAEEREVLDGAVLLVEDNRVNQLVARKLLERMGLMVDVVDNGKLAVDALRTFRYDLVIMDCQMPVMDGFTATRVIRDPATGLPEPNVSIVAMTANAMQGDRTACLDAGMDDYLTKPVDAEQVGNVVRYWLGRHRTHTAANDRTPASTT